MTSAELRAPTKTLAKWLAATTSLVFAFSRFLPSGRPGSYNIADDSWIQMLHTAFVERLQFGRDIVFTFGPWGFLYGRISSRLTAWPLLLLLLHSFERSRAVSDPGLH
jgi:hypothetical protein